MPKRRISAWSRGSMDRALKDQVPERITGLAVRDHRDRSTECIGGPATDAATRLLRRTPGALAGAEQGDHRSADGDPASGATNGRRWAAEDVFDCVPLSFCLGKERIWVCGQRGDIPVRGVGGVDVVHVGDGVVDVEWQWCAVLEVVGEGLQLVGVGRAGPEVLDRGAGRS